MEPKLAWLNYNAKVKMLIGLVILSDAHLILLDRWWSPSSPSSYIVIISPRNHLHVLLALTIILERKDKSSITQTQRKHSFCVPGFYVIINNVFHAFQRLCHHHSILYNFLSLSLSVTLSLFLFAEYVCCLWINNFDILWLSRFKHGQIGEQTIQTNIYAYSTRTKQYTTHVHELR